MTYQPLHHKYRPQTFAQLVGQPAIAATLTQAIATDKIAPAYLFTGPRGTGKTSSARIFAKSLNCLSGPTPTPEPCGTCESCRTIALSAALDVIELDAASNTGVDNIRELIERAQFAPVQCRYKLYLIDEVHMLSTAAFNALLKTLEEPPPRVVFVLATTDPQRVLPTIISRCQRFDFRRIPLPELTAHLQEIATLEKIDLTPAAIAQVAQLANGGLRDAESLLDQLGLLPGTVDVEQVWDLVGSIPERDLIALVQSLRAGDTVATLTQARQLLDRGREPLVLLQSLAGIFRDLLVAQAAPERGDLVALTPPIWEQLGAEARHWERDRILAAQRSLKDSELQIKNAAQPRLWLEVALLTLGTPASTATLASEALGAANLRATAAQNRDMAANAVVRDAPKPDTAPDTGARVGSMSAKGTMAAIAGTVSAKETSVPAAPDAQSAPSLPPEPIAKESQPAPTAASGSPEPIAPPPAAGLDDSPNLEPLWRQVMAQLPPATKALVGQHCRLLALDGTIASVGVRNANLLRLAESKKTALEAAFATVCQQNTRVQLEVAPTDFAPAEPVAKLPSPTDPLPVPPPAVPSSQQSAAGPAAPARDRRATKSARSSTTSSARPSKSQPKATAPAPNTTDVPEDLKEAVSALAGDFNGAPIDLGERADWQEGPPTPITDRSDSTDLNGEDDPDGFMRFGGAPDPPSELDDEVPFARQPPTGESWDVWEVAAHRPGSRPDSDYLTGNLE
ncbi:MAG: DNA polymerase III subunit gamma/tau [Cyanobacteria bacterium J06641_5]